MRSAIIYGSISYDVSKAAAPNPVDVFCSRDVFDWCPVVTALHTDADLCISIHWATAPIVFDPLAHQPHSLS